MTSSEANAATAGACGTIQLGGKTYLVGQPTDKDAQTIATFLRQRMKSPLLAMQADPDFAYLPEETKRALIVERAEAKFRNKDNFSPEQALEALASKEGVQFMAWILIRKNHPEFTLEQAELLITDENRARVQLLLDAASGMSGGN